MSDALFSFLIKEMNHGVQIFRKDQVKPHNILTSLEIKP
jgi:hypothetical protein